MHGNRFVALAALAAAGCPTRDISQLDIGQAIEVKADIPVSSNRNVDILFVIDNSDSMADKQNTLAANFPRFIDVLNTIQGGLPNVHIAVATSDVGTPPYIGDQCSGDGDDGFLHDSSDQYGPCPGMNGNRFLSHIVDPDGTVHENFTGDMADVFTCIARQGTTGCGFEQHLEGMKRALDGTHPENAGFLRADAYLAVIIIGDEDDCSARDNTVFDNDPQRSNINSDLGVESSYRCTEFGVECDGATLPRVAGSYTTCVPRGDSYLWDPQHYVNFLRQLKADPNLLIGAVIAGNTAPFGVTINSDGAPELEHSCSFMIDGDAQVADPAIRLNWFVQQLGDQGKFVSICQSNLSDAMTTIAKLLRRVIGTPCLDGNLDLTDVDPSMPGTQLDCQVSDVLFPGRPGSTETVLPRCPMRDDTTPDTTNVPCWWTTVDETACKDTETHIALKVERGGAEPAIGTDEVARCRLL